MELKELLKNMARELERRKIDYMIIGGQAVLIYGEPRLTKDIDITLGVNIDFLPTVLEVVKELKLKVLVENVEDFVRKTMVLPTLDEKTGLRIDFIFSYSEYKKEALKRVNKVKIDDVHVNYVSVEDLIIHKLISGRPRDIEDIKGILLRNRNIDEFYLFKWLKSFSKILEQDLVKRFLEIKKEVEL